MDKNKNMITIEMTQSEHKEWLELQENKKKLRWIAQGINMCIMKLGQLEREASGGDGVKYLDIRSDVLKEIFSKIDPEKGY